ncbi:MAG: hypothetical protein ACK56I_14810, partial [bacterium]
MHGSIHPGTRNVQYTTGFCTAQGGQRHRRTKTDLEVAVGNDHAVIAGQLKHRREGQVAVHQEHSIWTIHFKFSVCQGCTRADGVGLAVSVAGGFQPAL